MPRNPDGWKAWYNDMPGPGEPDPKLYVAGVYTVPSSHSTAKLMPDNEGIRDNPEVVVLKVEVKSPEIDDDMIKDVDVSWSDGGRGVKVVGIRVPNDEDIILDVGSTS